MKGWKMDINEQAKSYSFLKIGEHTYGPALNIIGYGDEVEKIKIIIGKFCSLADRITIILGSNHPLDWISTYPFNFIGYQYPYAPTYKGDIVIGNDVWIASNVTVMSGVSIGSGAIIGAHSVVASDIPPYCVAVGNPCRVVRERFSNDNIDWLLKLSWWDWPVEKIRKYGKYLTSSNIDGFKSELTKEI
jgi:acetyltransferase-like isoleucine patch superfamily enzyme